MLPASDFDGFPAETFRFLRALTKNNDKAWFDAHRDEYQTYYVAPARAFVEALGPELRQISSTVEFDPKVNGSLFRIQRDVRFSKDKTPYKNHLDLWFWHGARRGWGSPGFFFRMFADRLILGAGMHHFEKAHLDAFRKAVLDDRRGTALARALDNVRAAGKYTIDGATRKTVPRGLDPEHPRAKLLLHEGLSAQIELRVQDEPRTPTFVDFCTHHFRATWPVADWLLRNVATGV